MATRQSAILPSPTLFSTAHTTAYVFQSRIAHLLQSDMAVHQTSASAAIRIETPSFVIMDGAVGGMPKVREAFEASSRLIAFYRSAREILDREAAAATST